MLILLTGGAGFIGQYTARLLSAEHEVVALDSLLPQVHADPDESVATFPGSVIVGDVADSAIWEELPVVDAIIHLAAETGTAQSMYEQDRYRKTNVEGTRLAGLYAAKWGVPLVALSSRAVYGEGRYGCLEHGETFGSVCCEHAWPEASRESDPLLPVSFYGETKVEGERLLGEVAVPHVPVSIVRPQNVVGPGQDLHNPYTGVLAAFLAKLKEGKPITVYGSGGQTRDFVHVHDVARLLTWLATTESHTPGKPLVLNSGTGVRTTLNELAHYAVLGSPRDDVAIEHIAVHRAGDIEHAVADLSELVRVGAPAPEISTQTAVGDFIAKSWDKSSAPSASWDDALAELQERGLASPGE